MARVPDTRCSSVCVPVLTAAGPSTCVCGSWAPLPPQHASSPPPSRVGQGSQPDWASGPPRAHRQPGWLFHEDVPVWLTLSTGQVHSSRP